MNDKDYIGITSDNPALVLVRIEKDGANDIAVFHWEDETKLHKARVRENKSGEMYFLFNGRVHYFYNFIKVNDNPWIS